MRLTYEGAKFLFNLKDIKSVSVERHIIYQILKKKIGRFINKPYRKDSYLEEAIRTLNQNENHTVIDIGANIGSTLIPLALKFKKSQFIAVEPHPIPAKQFIKNCAINNLKNAKLVNVGISMEQRLCPIHTCETNSGAHNLLSGDNKYSSNLYVGLFTLKNLFTYFNIEKCQLLKIDTEGYDFFVLKSLEEYLCPEKISKIICEYNPIALKLLNIKMEEIIHYMKSCGYQCKLLGDPKQIKCETDIPLLKKNEVIDLVFF